MNDRYFEWLIAKIDQEGVFNAREYSNLLEYLDSVTFIYVIDQDRNRAQDGIDLRRRYLNGPCLPDEEDIRNRKPDSCSVLEMMIALSIRCEEHIADDPTMGNRIPLWFAQMIANLGLKNMTNAHFDLRAVNNIIRVFLHREYRANGRGGLFYIPGYEGDLAQVEIWYQMNYWYRSRYR